MLRGIYWVPSASLRHHDLRRTLEGLSEEEVGVGEGEERRYVAEGVVLSGGGALNVVTNMALQERILSDMNDQWTKRRRRTISAEVDERKKEEEEEEDEEEDDAGSDNVERLNLKTAPIYIPSAPNDSGLGIGLIYDAIIDKSDTFDFSLFRSLGTREDEREEVDKIDGYIVGEREGEKERAEPMHETLRCDFITGGEKKEEKEKEDDQQQLHYEGLDHQRQHLPSSSSNTKTLLADSPLVSSSSFVSPLTYLGFPLWDVDDLVAIAKSWGAVRVTVEMVADLLSRPNTVVGVVSNSLSIYKSNYLFSAYLFIYLFASICICNYLFLTRCLHLDLFPYLCLCPRTDMCPFCLFVRTNLCVYISLSLYLSFCYYSEIF